MSDIKNNTRQGEQNEFLRIKDFLYLCLAKWRWFVLSLVVALAIAVVYLLRTSPVYVMSAEVLIKESNRTQSIGGDIASMFADMGMSGGRTNVENEVRAMRSPAALLETGKRLALDVNYLTDGRFHKETLYGSSLPVKILMPDLADGESAGMNVRLLENGGVELSRFIRRKEKFSETVTGSLNDTIATPLGRVLVQPTSHYEKYMSEGPKIIYLSRTNLYTMTNRMKNQLTVSNDEKSRGTTIDLSYTDIIPQRAKDILNTLLSVYQESWMLDKNQITIATTLFITDRLAVIEQELGIVDDDIASYKSENRLPDIEAASNMYMAQSQETSSQILSLNTQLSMARYIHDYLLTNTNKNQLLPVNSGVESADIEKQISTYNDYQLQRNNLVANSSEKNPLVVDMDQSLAAIRAAIISSVENLEVTLSTKIADLQRNDRQIVQQIAASPDQEKYLLTVGRQQKIKEALYLFLLQKREENELSRTFTAYNMRILTPPSGTMSPIEPQKNRILMVAILLGLLIPMAVIFIRENTNTKIRGRKDLEGVTVPFIGEIPLLMSGKKKGILGKKPQQEKVLVVKEGNRDIINEAFRVLRTNLEFMSSSGERSLNVIAVTSFNPGSGKSFITMNMAVSLAIKGKKVLVIDGDMRHGSASAYVDSPARGLSDYLNGHIDNPGDVIVTEPQHETLHVLPVGTIPPNPTELLFSDRLKELITYAKAHYNYVLIDCPPIEIVADTHIIEKLSDRTIFVLRTGLLERSMLGELEKIYDEHKFKNMAMILNGTTSGEGRYGHRYGYHYGYGQGYHYGSDAKSEKSRK
jgi:capsular exopolysaccharide synthesis family protein